MLAQCDSGRGAVLMGAHLGSFEVIRSFRRRWPGLKVIMAMYEDNARKIQATFSEASAAGRHAAVREAIERYAGLLDRYCRSDPYNWFNFYDFWRSPDGASGT